MQMPWTTVEALTKDGNVPYQGQDSGFIREAENGIIMCDPRLTVVDFQTEYKLTEEEIRRCHMPRALLMMVSFT